MGGVRILTAYGYRVSIRLILARTTRLGDRNALVCERIVTRRSAAAVCCLVQQHSSANRLALYGILAWRAYPPQTMIAFTTPTSHGGGSTVVGPLVPNAASIDGVFSIFNSTIPTSIESQILFVADGKSWLTNGDVPLFVIQPGDSVWCGCNQIVGNTPVDEPAMFTFLWGYYFGKPRKLK